MLKVIHEISLPNRPTLLLKVANSFLYFSRKEAGTGRASITLELESPTYIQTIEIVNAGSAFVQVFKYGFFTFLFFIQLVNLYHIDRIRRLIVFIGLLQSQMFQFLIQDRGS